MANYLSLLVVLLLAAFSAASTTSSVTVPGWIICKWPLSPSSSSAAASSSASSSRMPADMMVRSFNVHAVLSNVIFVVGHPSEVPAIMAHGFEAEYIRVFDAKESLFVLEFNRKIVEEAARTFRARADWSQKLVWDLFESGLALVNDGEFVEKDTKIDWAVMAESIALKTVPIIPSPTFEESPISHHLKSVVFNPTIATVLTQISEDHLYDRLHDLSEGFHTRQSASEEIREAQAYLIKAFRDLGLNVTTHTYRSDYADNICADIVGERYPDQLVVTGAHYDSRSTDTNDPSLRAPGAVDNGSGTVGMLEMARVLSNSNVSFYNTIRICLWTGEEQGLLGSEAYAQKLKGEGANVLAYFNADMTGYQLPGTQITLGMKDKTITEWLLDLSYEITATYVPELPVALSASCCSDYISFYEQGYPSIGYFQNGGAASDYPDYHKVTDTIDKNNFEQMRLETQAVLAAVMTFAVPI